MLLAVHETNSNSLIEKPHKHVNKSTIYISEDSTHDTAKVLHGKGSDDSQNLAFNIL